MKQKLLYLYFFYFAYLAKYFVKRHTPYVLGVTGSIGKTSCRMIISQMITAYLPDKTLSTSSKNFNGELGLSLSILGIWEYQPTWIWVTKTIFKAWYRAFFGEKTYDILFLEYGIDHIWEMEFLLSIVQPDIAILTKIDSVHSSQFESKEVIAKEKYQLLTSAKDFAFLNRDDEFVSGYQDILKTPYFYYSTSDWLSGVDIQTKDMWISYTNDVLRSEFEYIFQDRVYTHISSNLIWSENKWYIGVWLHIVELLYNKFYQTSLYPSLWSRREFDFHLQPSRFTLLSGIKNSILIDSSYNWAPESMKKVIENFIDIHSHIFWDFEMILCLWDMRELGEYTQSEHEKLAHFIKDITPHILVVGESMWKYLLPLVWHAKHFQNSQLLGEYLKTFITQSDKKYMVLFKGSQNTIFLEEAIRPLLLNKSDEGKLCRWENFWKEKKKKFFVQSSSNHIG